MVLIRSLLAVGVFLASCGVNVVASPQEVRRGGNYVRELSPLQRDVFLTAMGSLDSVYNKSDTLWNASPRYSVWYGAGLLARNKDDDAAQAIKLFTNALTYQWTTPGVPWYGTFSTTTPFPPSPDSPKIYGTYDPNTALFITSAFIIVLEEFSHLVPPTLLEKIRASMKIAVVGDGYRVGGYDGDNLYTAYSNPWLMRVMCTTWVGNDQKDANLTYWGDQYANDAYNLFKQYSTLSEFNSGTYTGVSLFALSMYGYMPRGSVAFKRAPAIITKTWDDVGNYYNPTLKTLGGPFDRSYGFDMKKYFGILGGQIAGLVGGLQDGSAPLPLPLTTAEHFADSAILTMTPILGKFLDPLASKTVRARLTKLSGSRTHFAHAYSPPFDAAGLSHVRNYTSYTTKGLSVGGIEIDEKVVGGPATNPTAFTPGLILWDLNGTTSWFSYWSSSAVISSIATSSTLKIFYPTSRSFPGNTTTSRSYTFLIDPLAVGNASQPSNFMLSKQASFPGLALKVSGDVVKYGVRTVSYTNASVSGINGLAYYNLTYALPESYVGDASITIKFKKI